MTPAIGKGVPLPSSIEESDSLWTRFGRLWCTWTHPPPMWPVHSTYQCPKCLRAYHVSWADSGRVDGEPGRRGSVGAFDPVHPGLRP
jgi:hypothetical protein